MGVQNGVSKASPLCEEAQRDVQQIHKLDPDLYYNFI